MTPWPTSNRILLAGAASLWIAAFSISCNLLASVNSLRGGEAGKSVGAAVLGSSRMALSGHFFMLADLYMHRGVDRRKDTVLRGHLLRRVHDEMKPSLHSHAEGFQVAEIMPWLDLAVKMDPHNIETYLVTAFWLAGPDVGRTDIAEQLLIKAQSANPFNYQVQMEKGRLFLRENRIREAEEAFDAGLAFWGRCEDPSRPEARFDRASLLLYRALLWERAGETSLAAQALREIVSMFPERTHLLDRSIILESGGQPSHLAVDMWSDMLTDDARRLPVCHETDHGGKTHPDGTPCDHEGHDHEGHE